MAILERSEIESGLAQLGAIAASKGFKIELLLFGGTVMVLEFDARPSTRDLDVVILAPSNHQIVREMAATVAAERNWPADWLNDAVKGYIVGSSAATQIFAAPGIEVSRPSLSQLLAMKLCAWRDDVDIADARRLLQAISGGHDDVWADVKTHLQPGQELKARYAFEDLWEQIHAHP